MSDKLLVLVDAHSIDYQTLSTQLLRVSYDVYREQFTLIVDCSNPPLAAMLDDYAKSEHVNALQIVWSLDEALASADTILLFASVDRQLLFERCEAARLQAAHGLKPRDIRIFVVVLENEHHG